MTKDKRLDPPKAKVLDVAHTAVTNTLSRLVPVIGPEVAEFFKMVVQSPLQKRTGDWFEAVVEKLEKLDSAGRIDLESLKNNDEFTDVVVQASRLAITTSKREKKEALRNAVCNSALSGTLNSSEKQMYLNLIDQVTEYHLKFIDFCDNTVNWFQKNGVPVPEYGMTCSLEQVLQKAFPDLEKKDTLTERIWGDLYSRGIVNTQGIKTMMSATGWHGSRLSDFGRSFLRFICEP